MPHAAAVATSNHAPHLCSSKPHAAAARSRRQLSCFRTNRPRAAQILPRCPRSSRSSRALPPAAAPPAQLPQQPRAASGRSNRTQRPRPRGACASRRLRSQHQSRHLVPPVSRLRPCHELRRPQSRRRRTLTLALYTMLDLGKFLAGPTLPTASLFSIISFTFTQRVGEILIENLEWGDLKDEVASKGKKVRVKYVGKLEDGNAFDPTEGSEIHEFELGAGQVILGWEQGIDGMHVGGKRRLTIPPAMGYGDRPLEEIPANSCLIYDVELLSVSN